MELDKARAEEIAAWLATADYENDPTSQLAAAGFGHVVMQGRWWPDPDIELGPSAWLIDGVLPEGLTVWLYGPPGVGKSFLALDWALSLASGRPWLGKYPSTPTEVLYVNAEGSLGDFHRRFRAWEQQHGQVPPGMLAWHPQATLNHEVELGALMHSLKFGDWLPDGQTKEMKPGLIIIDTLAETLAGSDADGSAMAAWLNALRRLRLRSGASALIIHHPTKKDETMRGYSSLKGIATAAYQLVSDDRRRGATLRLSTDKPPRDGESFDEIWLERRQVVLELDTKTRAAILATENSKRERSGVPPLDSLPAITSCVIEPDGEPIAVNAQPTARPDPIVATLTAAGSPGMSRRELESATGLRGGSLDRRLDSLVSQKQIVKVRRGVYAIAA